MAQVLEKRGVPVSGLAVMEDSQILCQKVLGKIQALENKLADAEWQGYAGVAHTRWATHGQPSKANAHPHSDCRGKIFVVHNGIIENHQDLKEQLLSHGHEFESETDTEVLAHLVEEYHQEGLLQAVREALLLVQGTYGIAVLSADHPGKVVLATKGSPLILGIGDKGIWAASDVCALVSHTRGGVSIQKTRYR